MLKRTFSVSDTKSIISHTDKSIVKSKSCDLYQISREWKQTYLIYLLSSILIPEKEKLKCFLEKLISMDFISNYSFFSHEINFVPFPKDVIVPYVKKQEVLSPFQNFQYIGEGTFGKVFKCKHMLDEKDYAIKKISLINEENYLDEIKILSTLYHPNIVRYYNSWYQDNCLMIQMEYCPLSLRQYLEGDDRNEIILKQIIDGLCHLHEKQFIHFDLKPENILMTETNQVKIADFGYSRSILTSIYKSHYYEPSFYICKNDVEYATTIDVYSFGIILLEFILQKTRTMCEKLIIMRKQLESRDWNTTKPKYHSLLSKCLETKQSKRISSKDIQQLYF